MRVRFGHLLLTTLVLASGCAPDVRIEGLLDPGKLEGLLGRDVELVGVISNRLNPTVVGVSVWGLENREGQRVRAYGVLQRMSVIRDSADTSHIEYSGPYDGPLIFRPLGTHYYLEGQRIEFVR